MNETELKAVFEHLCKCAETIFHTHKEVKPFIFIFPKEAGPVHVIPINGDKDALALLVQYLCQKVGATAGAIVSEAWAVTLPKEAVWDKTPPSESPDRMEILQVSLYSGSLNRMRTWKILREGDRRSLQDCREEFSDRVESRFFGDYFMGEA